MGRQEVRLLVEKALAGEERAFAGLVERFAGAVYARVYRVVRRVEDAQDLVQEVFLRAFLKLGQLEAPERFPGWLITVADNTARSWYRRRVTQLEFERALGQAWAAQEEARRAREEEWLCATVRTALRKLTEAHREVVECHYFKGYSYTETADLLGVEVGTVRSRLQKARRRLREEMVEMKPVETLEFELEREDLEVLHRAGRFVSRDEKRPQLGCVCLDTEGRVVATDGARLLLRTMAGTKDLRRQVLLGPGFALEEAPADRGVLRVGPQKAALEAGDLKVEFPILQAAYVKYEKVIPAESSIQVRLRGKELSQALDLVAEHLEARHPVTEASPWWYRPLVEVRLSVSGKRVSIVTTRDMGYLLRDRDQEPEGERPGIGTPDWTFAASVEAKVEGEGAEGFRFGVSAEFLRDAMYGLDTAGGVEVRFTGPFQAAVLTPEEFPDRKALVMPVKLTVE